MAEYITHQPTELEIRLVAEREAADEAARAAVRAERQRIYDAREAALKASKPVPVTRTAPEPNRAAAEALRAALDADAWAALLRHVEVWNPAAFKGALKFIAQSEASATRHAEMVQGMCERAEVQVKAKVEAQAVLEAQAMGTAA